MKKINYKLKIAIIGKESLGSDIILDYLNTIKISEQESSSKNLIFQIIHRFIPIKIHIKLFETMNSLIYNPESINGFDFLFLILDLYDVDSLNNYEKELYNELCDGITFRGSSLLIALDKKAIKNNFSNNNIRISRHRLIRKCNELDLEYCYEINDPKKDLNNMFEKILDESIVKFKISNPELYEKVKEFGKVLYEKVEKI